MTVTAPQQPAPVVEAGAGPLTGLRVLDAFHCIGGAAAGYRALGAHVTGVDLVAWPDRRCDEFVQGDAVAYIAEHGHEYHLIHASPPCQGEGAPAKGTNARRPATAEHPRLIDPTRDALEATGRPYVIENVPGSSVRKDVRLCGEMFGLGVIMHRYFELGGWTMAQPPHPRHRGRVRGWRHGAYYDGPYVAAYGNGGGKATVAEMREAKGIDWSRDHFALREALPPAYTTCIGEAFAATLPTGAGPSPADILARLHVLADQWDAGRAGMEHWEKHWRARGDAAREGTSSGRVRQLADCAADLRNLANDLAKETP